MMPSMTPSLSRSWAVIFMLVAASTARLESRHRIEAAASGAAVVLMRLRPMAIYLIGVVSVLGAWSLAMVRVVDHPLGGRPVDASGRQSSRGRPSITASNVCAASRTRHKCAATSTAR